MSSSTTPAPTIVNSSTPLSELEPLPITSASRARKYFLFAIFCIAQFLDVFNNSALFSGIPAIAADLDMTTIESAWILSAYSLTFSSLLLVSGRISDVYSPKPVFVIGIATLGIMSIGAGFVRNKIGLLVIRAISGVGASLTIPPALNMIVQMFPAEEEQSRAIAIFGGIGGLANVLGLLIGALFVQYTSWHWIFWFLSILAIPSAIICLVLIPGQPQSKKNTGLDLLGISTLTAAFLLFIFAITSGSVEGWASARVLAPLIISVFLIAAFLFWETRIPEEQAALPPKLWFYPNFGVLAGVALLPVFWYFATFVQFTSLWQDTYNWSAISTAVHFLPLGIVALLMAPIAGALPKYVNMKWILLVSLVISAAATALLPFAESPDQYWRFAFPAFVIGSAAMLTVYNTTSIAFFHVTPPDVAGTVGAVFNSALQLGGAVGIAVVSTIQTSIDANIDQSLPEATHYQGRAAGFWFLLAIVALEALVVAIFYRPYNQVVKDDEKLVEVVEKLPFDNRGGR